MADPTRPARDGESPRDDKPETGGDPACWAHLESDAAEFTDYAWKPDEGPEMPAEPDRTLD